MENKFNMAKSKNNKPIQRKIKDRGVASPGITKAGFTKYRRRLENGGKVTT